MQSPNLIRNLIFTFWIFLGTGLFAEHIEHFEVNVTLEPSGEFVVTESILYDFKETQKHGIYREIPTHAYTFGDVNGVKWGVDVDVQLEDFEVTMDAKEVAWMKKLSSSSGKEVIFIKIGSKDKRVSDQRHYTIQYRCRNAIMPSSFQADKDQLHWNAVGDGWRVPVLQTEVNLFLPSKLHKNNLVVVSPAKSDEYIWIDEHYLQINANQKRASVKIVFPRGVLGQDTVLKIEKGRRHLEALAQKREEEKKADEAYRDKLVKERIFREERREEFGVWSWIVFLLLLGLVWLKRDALGLKKDTRSIMVRYNAPRNLSVFQMGLLFDKNLDEDDLYAAILELAYLGYIEIEEESEDIILRRVAKERGSLSDDQWQLLDALFDSKAYFSPKKATVSEYHTLFTKISAIYNALYGWAKKQGYTVGDLRKIRQRSIRIIFAVFVPIFVFSVVIAMNTDYGGEEVSYIVFCVFSALLPWIVVFFFNLSSRVKIALLFAGIGIWAVLMELGMFPRQNGMGVMDVVSSYITVMVLLIIFSITFMWKLGCYTQKGTDILRELKGLEIFLKSVKEDEIERRLKEDPDYMEKMLPYAILFGQVIHWLKMYDIMNIPLAKQKCNTLMKSLLRSDMLRNHINSSNTGVMGLSSNSTGSSSGSSSFGGAGGGSGSSW
ncbi:hypothetical protein YH65_08180 [Sulfurovum lithotrophicum]|uniref:DUF2207 domain-containing protein n=1 Tax=Sulfurovum lithotrophicum TaxID=206403 RepID=A0A7U4M1Z6_9BACT|nr:DUF2207 domain-containing protein [Sulfurovum lithotrophicum]AKF25367.1 hypothetical protein YH65_08180 [Sulfurovum lithotrophicum]